jgi:hypothetical protein
MKKLLLITCLLMGLSVFGQTEKGTIMTGGQLGLNTNRGGSSFRLNPQFGFFPADNLALGGELNLDFSKQGSVRSNEFGIGPFARYYFGKAQTKPFVVGSFNFLSSSVKSGALEINSTGWGGLFGVGFAAFITRNIALEAITGYRYQDYSNSDGSGGFSLGIGFQLYFNNDVVKDIKRTVTGD